MNKKTVAVIGSNGFVGAQIVNAIIKCDKYNVIKIVRGDPIERVCSGADIIIHSANPSKRAFAEKYPDIDFSESVEKTSQIYNFFRDRKFILVSSISCRTQPFTVYGRHRRACELIVMDGKSLTVRLGPMFGGSRKKDMLHDILAGRRVYVSENTKYAYVDVAWAGQKIVDLIDETGIKEIGAKNYIRLGDIAKHFTSNSEFGDSIEDQLPENFMDGPDANLLYKYASEEIKTII